MRADRAIADTEGAIRSGNLIEAYNLARAAAASGIQDPSLQYLEVLSLARMGDTSQAREMYNTYQLQDLGGADALSLNARLAKDEALAQDEPSPADLRRAADAYLDVHSATDDPFPLVNAATLAAAAGDLDSGRSLAESLLVDPQLVSADGYWAWITKAEALLVLGRDLDAEQATRVALSQADASLGARSSTLQQFERLFPLIRRGGSLPGNLLSALKPPPVLHFCGHIFPENISAEHVLEPKIAAFLERLDVKIGYGALAAGSDILVAELVLSREAELNVVLPFPIDEFIRVSVAPAGATWVKRFEQCCKKAASVTIVSDMPYVDDPRQLGYGAKVAMGMAVLRASHIGADALQVAIWDGQKTEQLAGTSADVATWAATGRARETIAYPEKRVRTHSPGSAAKTSEYVERCAHSILFADFSGFSKISERHLLLFWHDVMGNVAKVVDKFSASVLCKNTWGDALYLILDDPLVASELALSMQEQIGSLDLVHLGPQTGMRVALHYGTMYQAKDPVTGRVNFFGSEVSRAARLEPVTPRHSVYVTQPFAAILALKQQGKYELHYVGDIALAKGYGKQPVYRLSRSKRRHGHSRSSQAADGRL